MHVLYVLNRTLNENIEFLKRMAIEMLRLCLKIMRKYMQNTKVFLQFWTAVCLEILFTHETSFCFVCQDFASHSC